jgi:ssDNA thymidine ADP-ribosyltransferase, DarT
MDQKPDEIQIYHITDVENLPQILTAGGLRSDAAMAQRNPEVIGYVHIGYVHIKQRRLTEIRVGCCGDRFVGEFVPFYFCPRSPMLYTVNLGNTGRTPGCQRTIVHLVSTLAVGMGQNKAWAISDGNAGASHTTFSSNLTAHAELDWNAIRATYWPCKTHQKSAEFLIADFFDWRGFHTVGCHNDEVLQQVQVMLTTYEHRPSVHIEPSWYY